MNELLQNINSGTFDKKIYKYIEEHKKKIGKYETLDNYYNASKDTLKKSRVLASSPNNKIISNYARYITILNVGYFMSNEIKYTVNDNINIDTILDAYRKNTILKVDQSNANKCSKYGKSFELTYIDENADIKTKSISPKNAFIIQDGTLEENDMIGVYYTGNDIYVYTKLKKVHIIKTDNKEEIEFKDNRFGEIPLIEIKNNEEEIGDYENVLSLIDAYNLVVSNDIDNIEDFIDSILLLIGTDLTSEQIKVLRETRGLSLDKESRAEYLTKTLDETGISKVLERLRQDIHKFSFTPDMSDMNFAGNSSGVSLSYKILPFELLAKTKESFYEEALKKRFRLYNNYLTTLSKSSYIGVEELDIKFTRGLPKNDLEMAQMISLLQGKVTNKTLISGLSFIKDANEEDKLIKEEEKDILKNNQDLFKNAGHFEEEE